MSNNLVSQFPTSDSHAIQMENVSSSMNSAVSGMHMRMVSNISDNLESQHMFVSKEQMGFVEPMSSDQLFKTFNSVGHTESSGGIIGSNGKWMPNQLDCENGITNNMVGESKSAPAKRKAEVGLLSNSSVSQQSLLPNKRPAHLGLDVSSAQLTQPSAPQRKGGSALPNPVSPSLRVQSSSNKKMARNDSTAGKSGAQRGQPAKRQTTQHTTQTGSASKARTESSEAVRSKMRESLAAALALALQKPDIDVNTEKNDGDANVAQMKPVDSQASESNSTVGGCVTNSGSEEVFPPKELGVVGAVKDSQVLSAELPPNDSGHSFHDFQYALPDDDVAFSDNFFAKDDLLQGNGLSWAFDFDMQMREANETQDVEKPQGVEEEAHDDEYKGEAAILKPDILAYEIEDELFKIYDGVNKKYKEKGRSLLFNLKDRNNPELRERVMSGEISPQRLCSMSAEELASRELSEWRMAKAEEMAQMVVLPDVEVDVRRLVKKTHKGEYQVVEYDRDDGSLAEVSGGSSILTQPPPKKETETHSDSKDKENVGGLDDKLQNEDFLSSLIIQTDGTDLMQGMMVDELKDSEFLPPIVSLDEFMASLNSEPPFENLSADEERPKAVDSSQAADQTLDSPKGVPKAVDSSRAADQTSNSPKGASSKKADMAKKRKVDMIVKSSGSPASYRAPPSVAPKVDYFWEGVLQLTTSSSITVGSLYQSGEKTSTKEWPASLEIKGRVRLDAFEKYLQDLPKSRNRAVMILHFVLKDKSKKSELSNLSEAIDLYSSDERVGFAEPGRGVELYLCPSIPKLIEILNKNMQKKSPEKIKPIEHNGLIGIVVWRRAQISNTISPNSLSHHKHASKKRPFSPTHSKTHNSPNANAIVNTPPTRTPLPVLNNSKLDEDDDLPPGFGPGAPKDDDDLPEFNFSANINPSGPRLIAPQNVLPDVKIDKVRELIQKYGQSENTNVTSRGWVDNRLGPGIKPWNDDDDDDIPEWQPQAPHQLHHQPYPVVHGNQPPGYQLPVARPVGPVAPPRLGNPPPRWVQPRGPPHGTRWRHQ